MTIRKALRFEILRRDGFRCRYCGTTAADSELHVDHVTPEALGGQTIPENLVTACSDCNAGKGSNNPDSSLVRDVAADQAEWRGFIARARHDADAAGFDTELDRFDEAWRRWRDGAGIRLHRPPAWPRTVANYLADGLTIDELLNFIDVAMRKEGLTGDIPEWRYFCGCAKRRLGELRDTADELRQGVRQLKVGDTYRLGDYEVAVTEDREGDEPFQTLEVTFGGGGLSMSFGESTEDEEPYVEAYVTMRTSRTFVWGQRLTPDHAAQPMVLIAEHGTRLSIDPRYHHPAMVFVASTGGYVDIRHLVDVYETALEDAEAAAARVEVAARQPTSPQPQLLSELLAGIQPEVEPPS